MTPARRDATRVTIAIATTAKTPAHRIGDGDDTASREAVARREAEALRRDATRQPAGANKEEGSRMDACSSCATKGDARRRHTTTGDATTSRRTRDKREERCQQTSGDGASIGRGCAFRGRGRVERMRGGGINTTTSRRTRDYRGGGKSDGDDNGDGECRTPPSWDLAATALVLVAEPAATLIAAMPMAATAVSPSSAARLLRQGVG